MITKLMIIGLTTVPIMFADDINTAKKVEFLMAQRDQAQATQTLVTSPVYQQLQAAQNKLQTMIPQLQQECVKKGKVFDVASVDCVAQPKDGGQARTAQPGNTPMSLKTPPPTPLPPKPDAPSPESKDKD